MTEPRRPDPESLLALAQQEERAAGRGRLKIFFGANPGVGKTYAMLEDARARRAEGIDVVVGVVETHGRKETEALLTGLEVLPRRSIEYRGVVLQEFDLEAALKRRPALILVDELAHTNAPGSRHTRRFQDVEELLAAGISVYATLNVQHLESLNDVVAQITGVAPRETVPDVFFDGADEIELADLSPEDLLKRMAQGKVYHPEQATRASERFFRKGNLIALRELALRRVAERVDAQMRGYMLEHRIRDTWAAGERLLVCIGSGAHGQRLIRAARRLAGALGCEWTALHVETSRDAVRPGEERDAVFAALELVEEMGGRPATVSSDDPAAAILDYVRDHNITRILIGRSKARAWRDWLSPSVGRRLLEAPGEHQVQVVGGEGTAPILVRTPASGTWREYRFALLVVMGCTVLGRGIVRWLSLTDVAMLYLLGAVVVGARASRRPSLLGAVLSIAAFDFFFVPPALTFAVSDLRYLLTFGVMLVVAIVTSGLTVRIREQAEASRSRERRTAALYALSRDLAEVADREAIAGVIVRHLREMLGGEATALLPDTGGTLVPAAGSSAAIETGEKERGVADWVFRNGRPAGAGTDTLPGATARWLPLLAPGGAVGVIGIQVADPGRLDAPDDRLLLESMASQAALAIERSRFREDARRTALEVEAERLRTSLLSSLSHDLRTPLAAITGSASSLLADGAQLDSNHRRDLAQTILEEAQRMNRLVGNLLDMIRLESGVLAVQRDWLPLEEPIGVTLIRLDERLAGRTVRVHLPAGLPLVPVDGVLLEQVFINLLENAARYTPNGGPLDISAEDRQTEVEVVVADRGPGLPPGDESRVFDKFYRVPGRQHAGGAGLGLTICRGIITAHGGRMWARNREGGGLEFHFTLPILGTPPVLPPELIPEPETAPEAQ